MPASRAQPAPSPSPMEVQVEGPMPMGESEAIDEAVDNDDLETMVDSIEQYKLIAASWLQTIPPGPLTCEFIASADDFVLQVSLLQSTSQASSFDFADAMAPEFLARSLWRCARMRLRITSYQLPRR